MLELLLASLPSFVAVGELRHIWERGVVANELCGCGRAFHDCPFWQEVGERAFGGWDVADASRVIAMKRRVDRFRSTPFVLTAVMWPRFRRTLDEYAERTARVYEAVADVSGARVVVDSSKAPAFAATVGRLQRVDMRLVHLVRDSRGVAFSWRRRVSRPETSDGTDMPTFRPSRIAVEWLLWNSVFDLVARRRRTSVRYESLVDDAARQVRRIADGVGCPLDESAYAFLVGDSAELGVHHTVSGNRVRFHQGPLRLKLDTEWEREMSLRDMMVVSLITWPLLLAYSYRLRRPKTVGRHGLS